MAEYVAPFLLSTDPASLPEGQFTVPVCTTRERFVLINDALWGAWLMNEDPSSYGHLVDWLEALPRITAGCEPRNPVCRSIGLNSAQVEWFPESPYAPGEEVPEGYEFHPWTVANNDTLAGIIVAWGLGYKYGDVFTDLTKFPNITDPENFLDEYQNLPRFRVSGLTGAGTIKVEILSIPFGGRVVVLVDEFVDLLNLQAADTDADASFPPETIISTTITTEVTGDGEHTIDYVFYPTFEFELPFIGGGGGVRSIELCGFGVTEMAENGCCDETNVLLSKILSVQTDLLKLIKGGFELKPLLGNQSPNLVVIGNCIPTQWDEDPDDVGDDIAKRSLALCYTTVWYVKGLLLQSLIDMGMPIQSVSQLIVFGDLPPAFGTGRLKIAYPPTIVELLDVASLLTVTTDLLACQMQEGLIGKLVSFGSFRESFQQTALESMAVWLSLVLVEANQIEQNWRAFTEAMVYAMDIDLSGFTCPCVTNDCTEPLQLYFKDGRGVLLEKIQGTVAGTLYHLTGTAGYQNPNGSYGGGVYLKDALGRNFTMWYPETEQEGLPEGAVNQPVLYHVIHGACGTPYSEGLLGGFGSPTEGEFVVSEIYWDNQQSPIDTWWNIACYECP